MQVAQVQPPQLRRQPRVVAATMPSVMQPPKITDGTSPSSFAARPDSNAPSSFDEPMKMPLIADTRPRMASGVASCRIVERITTDTPSHRPDANSNAADSHKCARQRETDDAQAESGDRGQQQAPGVGFRRTSRQPEADQHRADRRRRAQDAERFGTCMQDVLDERRQQRDRAAEQHREHVQRQRAEQDLVAEHEAQAFVDAGEDRRALAAATRFARRAAAASDATAASASAPAVA